MGRVLGKGPVLSLKRLVEHKINLKGQRHMVVIWLVFFYNIKIERFIRDTWVEAAFKQRSHDTQWFLFSSQVMVVFPSNSHINSLRETCACLKKNPGFTCPFRCWNILSEIFPYASQHPRANAEGLRFWNHSASIMRPCLKKQTLSWGNKLVGKAHFFQTWGPEFDSPSLPPHQKKIRLSGSQL